MEENIDIDNMKINFKDNFLSLVINTKIYPMPLIYSAAYVFLDRAHVILDGDPEKEIIVKIRPKMGQKLEIIGREFNNERINYGFYMIQSERTKNIREAIVKRALSTNYIVKNNANTIPIADKEKIALPWSEQEKKINSEVNE
jgi:His-Xaa-Ser system protein HxsD